MSIGGPLLAGVARATVTPGVGIDMQGFAGRGPATGVHDDLYVTALVLVSGDESAAIVAGDLIGFSAELTEAIRSESSQRTGIAPGNIALCASHTHYGPTTTRGEGLEDADVQAYVGNLVHMIAGAVQEAQAHVKPAHAAVGRGTCDIGINRRERKPDGTIVLGQNPDGPIDRELIVVRIDTKGGEPLAALVNFAVHGVCQSSQTRRISADFVGPMRDLVESAFGVKTLYLQGACGDINPRIMEPCFEPARILGTKLGAAVLMAYDDAQPAESAGVSLASAVCPFPMMSYASADAARGAVAKIEAELDRLHKQGGTRAHITWAESRLERAQQALNCIENDKPLPAVEGEVMTLRFGDVAIVMAPGEIFNEIGAHVKANSLMPNTLFVGYANGAIGYMPVPEAYAEGGYEVDRACRIGPESAGMLQAEAGRLLAKLADGP